MTFESLDLDDNPFQVIVLRGTFNIIPDAPLKPDPDQKRVVTADEFYGEPTTSSMRFENDLAPFKPRSDIVINAIAHAPGGKPSRQWDVAVQVGKLQKRLTVTGPRYWKHHAISGWELAKPESCTQTLIRYEHAFGGGWLHKDKSGVYEKNPVGSGFVNKRFADKKKLIPAPRIMSPADPAPKLGGTYKPQGFSAIGKSWLPRRKYGGTYDERWLKERSPKLPKDFDFLYYNCAHPDLIYDGYLRGDEVVVLKNLHKRRPFLQFYLPNFQVSAAITDHDAYRYAALGNLDTLYLDVEESQAFLVWRITLPIYEDGIKRIEARLKQPSDKIKHEPMATNGRRALA